MDQCAIEPYYTAARPVLIVANAGPDASAAGEAVALAGGRDAGRVAWSDAAERLTRQGVLGLVVVEAITAADAVIEATLPRIAALARANGAPIVIVLAEHQIDLIAPLMLDNHATMLCAPSMPERVAALSIALAPPPSGRAHEAGREAEAARLRRLNEEVARIAETLARLSRDNAEPAPRGSGFADRTLGYAAPPPAIEIPAVAPRDIRAAIRARRLRDKIIPGGLFEDPAWDMLLDLAAAELERVQVSVSSLCIAAAVAPTTALRWIGKLIDAGLLERRPDPFDRRRAFMALTERGRDAMWRYLAAVRQEGLAIA